MDAKKKRTIFLIAGIIIVFAVLLMKVFLFPPIPSKPKDAKLEFWITENVDGVDWTDYDEPYGMFGGHAYLGKDYPLEMADGYTQIPKEHVIYTITAWPDYADDETHVTEIEITDPAITVYGLTIDSSFDDFDGIFRKLGYQIYTDKNEYWEQHRAEKNGIAFSLQSGYLIAGGDMESIFAISAEVSNRENIVF